jgi:capsular polysaccharide biosynthesis protein
MSIAFVLGFLGVKGVEFISEYLTEKIKKEDGTDKDNK